MDGDEIPIKSYSIPVKTNDITGFLARSREMGEMMNDLFVANHDAMMRSIGDLMDPNRPRVKPDNRPFYGPPTPELTFGNTRFILVDGWPQLQENDSEWGWMGEGLDNDDIDDIIGWLNANRRES